MKSEREKYIMKEFFGFGGYTRPAEGFLSWQHITFVTTLLVIMMALAVILGNINRKKDDITKNKALIAAAILIDAVEIFKIVIMCVRSAVISLAFIFIILFLVRRSTLT